MGVIESRIDINSDEFKANQERMKALVEELNREVDRAHHERSQKSLDRLRETGKLTVDEKFDLLLDKNTPFLEIAPLAAKDMYDGKIHGCGLRAGIGIIRGREVMVSANDATIKGGAAYPMAAKKTLRLQTIAMENRLPSVTLVDSAGAYLPLQSEMFPDIDGGGRIFYNQAMMSKMRIPQIVAVMGLCTAGGAYGVAMSDEIVHVKGHGAIFLGGPPLVLAATGEEVTPDELGGPEVHCDQSGVSDYYAEDDAHAIAILREIVGNLPKTEKSQLTRRPVKPPLYEPEELYGIIPRRISTPYDIREILARMVDGSDFLEFKERYGPTLVCGWAHIHGYPVGILANNGVLFPESARKATQFIQICDNRKIPLWFVQNISGFIVGRSYEAAGVTKDGHKMVNAVSTASVPKFTLIAGASFGAGNYAMCGRAYSPRFLWMWPNAEIGVMGGEQAAGVLETITNDQNVRLGKPPLTEAEAEALKQPIIEAARKEGNAYYSTAHLWDDGILDPVKTRDVMGLAISASLNAPLRDDVYGFGVFRM